MLGNQLLQNGKLRVWSQTAPEELLFTAGLYQVSEDGTGALLFSLYPVEGVLRPETAAQQLLTTRETAGLPDKAQPPPLGHPCPQQVKPESD